MVQRQAPRSFLSGPGISLSPVEDDLKPRRPQWEEKAEIDDLIARSGATAEERFLRELERPPGEALLLEAEQKEMEDEADLRAWKEMETASERAESERILRIEAQIEAERPFLRERELRRTFSQHRQPQAA